MLNLLNLVKAIVDKTFFNVFQLFYRMVVLGIIPWGAPSGRIYCVVPAVRTAVATLASYTRHV